MDALIFFNSDKPAFPAAAVEQLLSRAAVAQGVIVRVTAPQGAQAAEQAANRDLEGAGQDQAGSGEASSQGTAAAADTEELILSSAVPDVFEGVDDLALGLGDLHVDRLIIAGVDEQRCIHDSAMAALTLNFDVVLLSDGIVDSAGEPVDWADAAAAAGALWQEAAKVWLRM